MNRWVIYVDNLANMISCPVFFGRLSMLTAQYIMIVIILITWLLGTKLSPYLDWIDWQTFISC